VSRGSICRRLSFVCGRARRRSRPTPTRPLRRKQPATRPSPLAQAAGHLAASPLPVSPREPAAGTVRGDRSEEGERDHDPDPMLRCRSTAARSPSSPPSSPFPSSRRSAAPSPWRTRSPPEEAAAEACRRSSLSSQGRRGKAESSGRASSALQRPAPLTGQRSVCLILLPASLPALDSNACRSGSRFRCLRESRAQRSAGCGQTWPP